MELILNEKLLKRNMSKHDEMFFGDKKYVINVHWSEEKAKHTQVLENENYERVEKDRIINVNAHNEAAEKGFDNVAVASFYPNVAYMMSSAYGCTPKKQNDLLVTVPCREIGNLDIDILTDAYIRGFYKNAFSYIERFQENYPSVPLTVSDTQSPIDVFNLLFPVEDAIYNFYDYPQESMLALKNITQSIINVNRKFQQTIRNFAGFRSNKYWPKGAFISNDDAAYLSPEIYEEFEKPFDAILSDEFGGISFHVCMKYEQNIKNLTSIKNFVGFDCMPYYNNLNLIMENVQPHNIWEIYNWPWSIPPTVTEDHLNFYKRIMDTTKDKVKLNFDISAERKVDALALASKVKEYALKTGWGE